jgi:hypothetical protein
MQKDLRVIRSLGYARTLLDIGLEIFLPRLRSSDLSDKEVVGLYEAVSFRMWQFGAVMNCHITIAWSSLNVVDHHQATKMLGQFLNRCRKWGRVGLVGASPGPDRRRQLRRPGRKRHRQQSGEAFIFRYIFVNECSGERGFHSHVLCHLPWWQLAAFTPWTRAILSHLTHHPCDETTVKVVPSRERNVTASVERQWSWFRYMCKQLDPQMTHGYGDMNEAPRRLRDILQLWPYRSNALPVTCDRPTGASRDIGGNARKAAGFRAIFYQTGGLTRLYDGHELDEYQRRQ